MGEAAEMLLDGLLDEETGEYIGDRNKRIYGEFAPGFPVTYNTRIRHKPTEPCPICGKECVAGGPPLQQHMKAKHSEHTKVARAEAYREEKNRC